MFSRPSTIRAFSTVAPLRSKIGGMPISLPPTVKLTKIAPTPRPGRKQDMGTISVEGPLGLLSLQVPDFISVEIDTAAAKVTVTPQDARERLQRERWGTVRAMLQNHITGVSEGHVAILRLVGVGYRASIEERPVIGKIVNLKVQYAHPVELPVPVGVTASTPQPTRILLEGANKEVVTQFAAEIRAWRKPEPYKGKGIFVNNETIKLKTRKIK
ncbi:60S ribosomal protein-like protein L6 [Tricharina praecox]|uniref:60S ribosomal protein-like protein L6 n=1 Tax=Tricharina praecox TaxID=43433 RepID=UPI00221EC041|nr:60S ribosomal protein-like protein L6 [Tricharina praecox]KAI5850903.1 60S ribosomal protein-like protein L6 [Tricharina praecox]